MNENRFYLLLAAFVLVLTACQATTSEQPTIQTTPGSATTLVPADTATQVILPSQTLTPVPTGTDTVSVPPTETLIPTSRPTETETLKPTPQPRPQNGAGLVIDHQSIALFDQIPAEYLQAASEILWLYRHASVGANIRFGLDCLYNYFPDRTDPNRRPFACDKGLDPASVVFGKQYNSSNWVFEPHAELNPNPGWYNKVKNFIMRIENLIPGESYNYASFDFGYREDPTLLKHFFTNTDPNDAFPSVYDLEALQAEHPETTFIWWTTPLARETPEYILEFNQQMRAYAAQHNHILFDLADIESHSPDGAPCTGIDANQNPTQLTAVCDEYADEIFAGHLNALGRDRAAKALWVMMAVLAGWDGQTP